MYTNKQPAMRKITPLILFLSLSAFTACITACGQKGALYLPQDNTNTLSADDNTLAKESAVMKDAVIKNVD